MSSGPVAASRSASRALRSLAAATSASTSSRLKGTLSRVSCSQISSALSPISAMLVASVASTSSFSSIADTSFSACSFCRIFLRSSASPLSRVAYVTAKYTARSAMMGIALLNSAMAVLLGGGGGVSSRVGITVGTRVLLTVCVSKAYATRASMAGTTACATRPSLYTTKHGPSGSVPRSRGSVNHDTSATLFSRMSRSRSLYDSRSRTTGIPSRGV
mmetsp:Transcript_44730/g.115774  ORF Transcript_44730/g.115774 Transcript_44730/m.115774 type:complete len:217 (-) Transcript_44730:47-697(-)